MSRDDKKEYLECFLKQQAKIKRWRELAQSSPDKNEIYKEKIERACRLRDNIEYDINNLDSDLLCEILSQKYLCGKTLEQTALTLNYSKRQIERLHIKAVDKLVVTGI